MKNKYALPAIIALTVILSLSCMLFRSDGRSLGFEPNTLPDAQVGMPYEVEIHVTENRTPVGSFSISEGELPAGLELKPVETAADTAKISGTPEEAGTFTFTIRVWCYGTNVSGQTGENQYSIVVGK